MVTHRSVLALSGLTMAVKDKQLWFGNIFWPCKLGILHPFFSLTFWRIWGFIFPIPKNISGIDILQSQTLQTFSSEFHLQVRIIKPVLRGNTNRELVILSPPGKSGDYQPVVCLRGIRKYEKIQELHPVDMYALPIVLSISSTAYKKVRWLMEEDSGLPGTKRGSVPHPWGYAQHCHHLRYLSHSSRCMQCLFQYIPGHWITKLICLHMGGATMDPSSSPLRLPA